MRRRSASNRAVGFSLFTFLDGLLCVTGAMIVVLAVIAPRARKEIIEAAQAHKAEQSAGNEELAAELAELEWRSEHLRESRAKTATQLEQQRLELSHIEDHARALRDQLAELEAATAKLAKEPANDDRQLARLRSELATLTARVAAAEDDLKKARKAAADPATPSYAIVPYEGPNQTHRRPLYIECASEGIILQPEGIVLTEEDFFGPLGPGNPLAAALRAQREYLARGQRTNRRESGEPYPLLLVRPDGIGAYYAAREAMTSWGSDFGYELIDQEWKLDFNAPDPELAKETQLALDEARVRQRQLARAAPRRYSEAERPVFRASPTQGGLVREGGSRSSPYASGGRGGGFGKRYGRRGTSGVGDDEFGEGNSRAGSIARRSGSGSGSGGGGANGNDTMQPNPYEGLLDGAAAGGKSAGGGNSNTGGSSADNKSLGNGNSTGNDKLAGGQTATGDGTGSADAAEEGPRFGGGNKANGKSLDGKSNSTQPNAGNSADAGSDENGTVARKSGAAARTPGEQMAVGGQGAGSGGNGTGNSTRGTAKGSGKSNSNGSTSAAAGGQRSTNGDGESTSATGQRSSTTATAGSGGSGSSSEATSGDPTSSANVALGQTAQASLADRRGKNWGLPDTVRSAVPITRPLRIDCTGDRLVVRSEENAARGAKVVPLKEKTEDSIEELVSIVWEHIDKWGSAGRGMYWRPILSVDVQPGGAARFADLQILLADSGLDVRARGATSGGKQPANTKRR